MATSNDHPGVPFVQARGFTAGRPDGPPLWIVWHTIESAEAGNTAEAIAGYFANPGDGRDVSYHWAADNNSIVGCVDEDDTAWAVGNRAGNYRGISIGLAGRAAQTRAQWLDTYSRAMLGQAAPVAARAMRRWQIPNRWCTLADLESRRPGHTTHADLVRAFNVSDHTDPGPHFPRDLVLDLVADHIGGSVTVDDVLAGLRQEDQWASPGAQKDAAAAGEGSDRSVRVLIEYILSSTRYKGVALKPATVALLARLDAATGETTAALAAHSQVLVGHDEALAHIAEALAALTELVRAGGGDSAVAALAERLEALQTTVAALEAAVTRLAAGHEQTRARVAAALGP